MMIQCSHKQDQLLTDTSDKWWYEEPISNKLNYNSSSLVQWHLIANRIRLVHSWIIEYFSLPLDSLLENCKIIFKLLFTASIISYYQSHLNCYNWLWLYVCKRTAVHWHGKRSIYWMNARTCPTFQFPIDRVPIVLEAWMPSSRSSKENFVVMLSSSRERRFLNLSLVGNVAGAGQCDQIWRNFTTWANLKVFGNFLWGLI